VHQKNTIATGSPTRFYVKINTRKSLTHTRAWQEKQHENNVRPFLHNSRLTHRIQYTYISYTISMFVRIFPYSFSVVLRRYTAVARSSSYCTRIYLRVYTYFIILLYLFLPGFLVLFGSDIARGRTLFCRSAVKHHNNIIRSNVVYSA